MVPALPCLCCEQFMDFCPRSLFQDETPAVPSAPQVDVGWFPAVHPVLILTPCWPFAMGHCRSSFLCCIRNRTAAECQMCVVVPKNMVGGNDSSPGSL